MRMYYNYMHDVDKIIEMALDFNVHEVENPFDPEIRKQLAGQRVVVYYGASSNQFWDIMRNGIQARPTLPHMRTMNDGKQELDWRLNDLQFTTAPASDQAHYKAYTANNERSEGPNQPMIVVAEVTFQKMHEPGKGRMAQLVGQAMGADVNTALPLHVKPNQIVGIVYPAATDKFDIPIKKFLEKVRSGLIDGIGPDPEFEHAKYRPYGPTKEAWQHVLIRYVNDLLNYSSNLFDYLLGREKDKLNDVVVRESGKIGLGAMMRWTGREMMEWLYSILPYDQESGTSKEDDIEQVLSNGAHEGWNHPFYDLFRKYSDDSEYLVRKGKKEPYQSHDE